MTDLSIIIVNYNGTGFIEECFASILDIFGTGHSSLSYEVIVVDNASRDESPDYIDQFCKKYAYFQMIINTGNIGFGAASNKGAAISEGKFLLFLNPDCKLLEGGIDRVIRYYEEAENAGAIGVKILDRDGSLQLSCRAFPGIASQFYESYFLYRIFKESNIFGSYFMTWWDHQTVREVDWLSGSFILIKKQIFKEIGGFDSDYFMYSEDTDLCRRLYHEGFKNYYYPGYLIEHADGGIASRDMALREAEVWKSRRLYFIKNYSRLYSSLFSFI